MAERRRNEKQPHGHRGRQRSSAVSATGAGLSWSTAVQSMVAYVCLEGWGFLPNYFFVTQLYFVLKKPQTKQTKKSVLPAVLW